MNLKPRDIVTKQGDRERGGRDHGHRRIDQCGAALSWRSPTAAQVEWTIDDFERMRRKVPVLCDLKPSGKYLAIDLHRAGGIPTVMKVLLEAGLLHGDCMTITGKTMAEVLADVPPLRADQDVIFPVSKADVRAGPPGHPEGQPVARRRGGQDHRPEEPGHHRPGARVRRRAERHGRHHGQADQGRAT